VTEPRPGWRADPGWRAGPADPGWRAERADQLLATLAATGAATATELAAGLPLSRQAIAKHLAVLRSAGLVARHKEGRDVRFSARTQGLMQTAGWLAGLATEWEARLAAIKRMAESGS
jgi:DNA-binding transcriptional ArsR family regulator